MCFLRWIWALLWLVACAVWPMFVLFVLGFALLQRDHLGANAAGLGMLGLLFLVLIPRLAIGQVRGEQPPEPWTPNDEASKAESEARDDEAFATMPNRPRRARRGAGPR